MANSKKRKATSKGIAAPKRLKPLAVSSITKAKLSEGIVDEILKTPELVSKVFQFSFYLLVLSS